MFFHWHEQRIHYSDEGTGTALVFLHGLGGRGENWIHQRKHFSLSHRVICLDLPGHGRSSGKTVTFASYWQVLEALLDHLGITACCVCGLSKGARVGMDFAAQRPERVSHLVVVNAFVHLKSTDLIERLELYELLSLPDGPMLWAERLIAAMGVAQYPSIVRGFLKSVVGLDPAHIQRIFFELIDYDQRPELWKIAARTLLVRGEQDHFVPLYCVEDLQRLIHDSAIVRLPDCGHLPYLEAPDRFNQLLDDFLQK
ncbi:MAG: alpha/beta fold hydrolase [Pseudomonas sp.]